MLPTESNSPLNQRLENITKLLGEQTVLLPIKSGSKSPIVKEWTKLRPKDTSSAEYKAQLTENIGILLGQASNHLCTIDVDTDAAKEEMLALNPAFKETLTTTGARGCNFWFRVRG